MALYEIIETPGKERVYPLDDDQPPRTQDEAKIIVQRLRAEAKVAGRQVDFIIRPMGKTGNAGITGNGAAATSVRLTEENRAKVARFCGRMMMATGEPMSMGDAVAKLVEHFDKTAHLCDESGNLDDDLIIAHARAVRQLRKSETADA